VETASLGRQCLNTERQAPAVLLSVGDILEETRTAASFALCLCGSLAFGKLRVPWSLRHPRLPQSSDLSQVLNCFALVDYLV